MAPQQCLAVAPVTFTLKAGRRGEASCRCGEVSRNGRRKPSKTCERDGAQTIEIQKRANHRHVRTGRCQQDNLCKYLKWHFRDRNFEWGYINVAGTSRCNDTTILPSTAYVRATASHCWCCINRELLFIMPCRYNEITTAELPNSCTSHTRTNISLSHKS